MTGITTPDEFEHEIGSWWFALFDEDRPDNERRWQVCARYWNPDSFQSEYRLRRPLTDDATDDDFDRSDWEFRTVKRTDLGELGYQAMQFRDTDLHHRLTEKHGDASTVSLIHNY